MLHCTTLRLLCIVFFVSWTLVFVPKSAPVAAQTDDSDQSILLRQWASSATATSQYGTTSWNAGQATGQPNVEGCGDNALAWASLNTNTRERLTLKYDVPVIPTQVNIYQSYNPGVITAVELLPAAGTTPIKLPRSATTDTKCPGVFTIDISEISKPISGIVIHIDQTKLKSWSEIDAVELVGYAEPGARLAQWALQASASSQYGDSSWSAQQATGAPNVIGCGDNGLAWASRDHISREILTVMFGYAVIPEQVKVYQTYTPGAITSIDLLPLDGSAPVKIPNSADTSRICPHTFQLNISDISKPVNGMIIYIDQSKTGNWNEIDAVQLIGLLPSGTNGGVLRQWATGATATSEFSRDSAQQATGEPNVYLCSNSTKAWASKDATSKETLTLFYDRAVIPYEVNIHQSHNPGAVVGIELIGTNDQKTTLKPHVEPDARCPGILTVRVKGVKFAVKTVKVHLDQSKTRNRNQIDAVELVGMVEGGD